ncbi:hypothetical protein [Escherichia coli]|uniref:hypothetical protein n=1 Tax=Escherichia coli TaxID=562 RepID=UPI003F55DEBB
MDKSKEAFVEWFHARCDSISMPPEDRALLFSNQWAAWQASRSSIEIDIKQRPFFLVKADACPTDHYMAGIRDAKEDIRSAGIKVKGE